MSRSAPAAVERVKLVEREALESFTATEAQTVDAIVARLIPTDANGPGAAEARVGRYIDRALAGGLGWAKESYTTGLAQLDAYCRSTYGADFAALSATQQDAVLTNLQANTARGFTPDSRTFFNLIREHALQGMFGDPFHGGNENFVGWDLVGYPGVKIGGVSVAEQAVGTTLTPVHASGYKFDMFQKKAGAKKQGSQKKVNHGH
jgi:gluconate 2-dehydrogenase gamma chain